MSQQQKTPKDRCKHCNGRLEPVMSEKTGRETYETTIWKCDKCGRKVAK